MMIDRRDFVACTALVAVTPALRLLRPDAGVGRGSTCFHDHRVEHANRQ